MNFFKNLFYKRKQKKSEDKGYIDNFLKIVFKHYTLHKYKGELWYINTTTKKFLFYINEKNTLVYNSNFFYVMNMYLNIDKDEFIDTLKSVLKKNLINVKFICEDMVGNDFTEKINLIENTKKNTNKILF